MDNERGDDRNVGGVTYKKIHDGETSKNRRSARLVNKAI